jgi:hypothetical protein
MNKTKKGFDAVAMMRSIRDKVSTDIEGMTLEQELAWLASQKLSDPFLKRLRDDASQPGVADSRLRARR